jgi:asparagine synthase (glutamine-hydrolysing)
MCGIAGLVGSGNFDAQEKRARRMMNALARRGPDGEGVHSWTNTTLGHRRLAIFDLSDAGRQPMLSPDGKLGVVFNGAIYNFLELRAELEKLGFQFKSRTDTEVLLHGYKAWGLDELVRRMRGMFAIGLWDDEKQKLFLIRDRLGVKPLVYAARDGELAFASTVRALRAAGFGGEIDEQGLAEYLEFGFITDEFSIYKGISKLPAATILEWTGGEVKRQEYWTLPEITDTNAPSFEEAVQETERLFSRAVELRLQADVAVGALLSGGVDSSLVCWAIKKLGGDVTAYTVSTPGDVWDEAATAISTANKLGVNHKVLELTSNEPPSVDELANAYTEPFACASALGMLRVSEAVRKNATVLLTGDGGDDVFLGYPEHRHFWLAQRLAQKTPSFAADAWKWTRNGFPRIGPLKRASSFMDYIAGGLGAVGNARDGLPVYERTGMLGPRLRGKTISHREMKWSLDSSRNLLAEFLRYDRHTRFVGEYLPKVDGATMFHSLEARSPFLDQHLWEFAASLPFDIRLKGGRLKAILRELARRHVSEEIALGKKQGFGIPVQRWIAGRWRAEVEESLRDSLLAREGWIDNKAALDQLKLASQKGFSPKQLWYIFVLEAWMRGEKEKASDSMIENLKVAWIQ